jgi:hypothetical protein
MSDCIKRKDPEKMDKNIPWLSRGIILLCVGYSLSFGVTPVKIGFNAGLVGPENFNVTIGGGGLMDFGFDLGASGSIHVQPAIELWYASQDFSYGNPLYPQNYYTWKLSVFELSVNPMGRYYFPVSRSLPVQPFAGMGFAFSIDFSHVSHTYTGVTSNSGNSSDLGFCLGGGIDFFIGRNRAFVEVREKFGDIDVFKLLFGMMFPFGSSR